MADQDNRIDRDEKQINSTYDAEKEIPDPEQVERDRQRAEQEYGGQDQARKNPAA